MSDNRESRVAAIYERHRQELVGYLSRMVVQPGVPEEIAQEAALRLLQHPQVAEDDDSVRAWLFRVSTNLALDHLRRHSTRRELPLLDIRERAEADADFVSASDGLRGSPETQAIAREHLVACFACTLRNLPGQQAAALLLKEVYGFSTAEVATVLDARFGQVKHWIQAARDVLTRRYATTCALVTKGGVCYQCVELDQFFNGKSRDPLGGAAQVDARLTILRELKDQPLGPWHAKLFKVVGEIID